MHSSLDNVTRDQVRISPLLPTQVIGSHAVPGWAWILRDAIAAGTLGPADIAEALRDAVNVALMDMTEPGADIVPDGEMPITTPAPA